MELDLWMVGQIKVREMSRKRYKPPSLVLDRRSFADRDGSASLVRWQTGRSSAYEVRVGERPVCHPASVSSGLGWPRDGVRWVVFLGLSKLHNQEDALGAPCLDT